MRKLIATVSLIIGSISFTACGGPPPSSMSGSDAASQSFNSSGVEQIRSGIPAWPPAIEEGANVSLADDQFVTNIVIAIDTSGSMDGGCDGTEKFDAAIRATHEFLEIVPDGAAVGLVNFGGRANIISNLTTDRSQTRQAIDSLKSGGDTPMSTAIHLSNNLLTAQGQRQSGNGQYHLVILGDGDPIGNETETEQWLNHMVWNTNVAVHTIGFCANIALLDGEGINYNKADNIAELSKAFASVLAEVDVSGDGSMDIGSW